MAVQKPVVDLLLKCNDHIRVMYEILKGDLGAKIDSSALMGQLQVALDGGLSTAAAPSEPPAAAAPEVPAAAPAEEPVVEAPPPESFVFSPPPADAFADAMQQHAEQAAPEAPPAVNASAAPVVEAAPAPATAPAAAPSASGTAANVDESIRVSLRRLEKLMNNVGELVIFQEVLNQQKEEAKSTLMQKTITQLSKVTREIQDISMSLRLVSLKQTFQKMQRIVRDTSNALKKEVQFELSGEDTEIDKTILESLGNPLVHLIRNAVDHGLEMPDERVAFGKPKAGKIRLTANTAGSTLSLKLLKMAAAWIPLNLSLKP